ncbi:MAG: hypothetical protein MUE31_02835 [Candidatus Nanopelagicales bacterium]|jgi:hypothetical protein|nr:hypothetical protein [Candidatus Nanopelagicales bacterium]
MSVAEKQYGWTVLGTGLVRMWRGFLPFIVVSLLNALVQASLRELSPLWLAVGISAALLLLAFALMAHIAVRSVDERSGLGDLRGTRFALFALWVVGWTVVITIGLALYFWPGVLLLALTPFVPVAAAAGVRNPLGANFAAIRSRPVRYLVTVAITLLVLLVMWLISALNAFFVRGWVASFTTWLVIGLVAAWLLTAWAALFRSTEVGRE